MTCTARIRPFIPVNDTELRCENLPGHIGGHAATLRDYAYPGSTTVLSWQDTDRRTFHGHWPGACTSLDGCTLPTGHHGNCAA